MVSIIIPVFNRMSLIAETLESVLNQSYKNWECVVVDDGSTDDTLNIIDSYGKRDPRITCYKRPIEHLKGANSCRNFGFKKSSGDYIIWFDSDDIMTSDHIETKIKAIQRSSADFVVAQTANFEGEHLLEPYKYEKKPYGIKASDFILLKIHWYTYDVLLKREIAKQISWNEKMKSWQDYNYFCKMLLTTENGKYIDQVLTHRRLHSTSIQNMLTRSRKNFSKELLENRILTFKDIKKDINPETKKELIFGMMNLCVELAKFRVFPVHVLRVIKTVQQNLGLKAAVFFITSLKASYLTTRGHLFLEKAKGRK